VITATELWSWFSGDGPLIAAALHAGHEVRDDVVPYMSATSEERVRLEEPFTDRFTAVADTSVVVKASRFEFDLDRPRERAIYENGSDAWGLEVWAAPLPEPVRELSLRTYDRFYELVESELARLLDRHPRVALLDLHAYNHRPDGPDVPSSDLRPTIDIGTAAVDQRRWRGTIDAFIDALAAQPFDGQRIDVCQDRVARDGHLARWLGERHGDRVLVLPISFKKVFMDEWTGEANVLPMLELQNALAAATGCLRESLSRA
jgi:N-formylglutamate amidohydrolase